MIKKIINNSFIFILSIIMWIIYILIFYFAISNIFFTVKNWNNTRKGVIVSTNIQQSIHDGYTAIIHNIKIDDLILSAKEEIDTNYEIGDSVLVQLKGNKNVRILYVNGKKVGSKIRMFEYISFFFTTILLLISIVFIKNKFKKIKSKRLD